MLQQEVRLRYSSRVRSLEYYITIRGVEGGEGDIETLRVWLHAVEAFVDHAASIKDCNAYPANWSERKLASTIGAAEISGFVPYVAQDGSAQLEFEVTADYTITASELLKRLQSMAETFLPIAQLRSSKHATTPPAPPAPTDQTAPPPDPPPQNDSVVARHATIIEGVNLAVGEIGRVAVKGIKITQSERASKHGGTFTDVRATLSTTNRAYYTLYRNKDVKTLFASLAEHHPGHSIRQDVLDEWQDFSAPINMQVALQLDDAGRPQLNDKGVAWLNFLGASPA